MLEVIVQLVHDSTHSNTGILLCVEEVQAKKCLKIINNRHVTC